MMNMLTAVAKGKRIDYVYEEPLADLAIRSVAMSRRERIDLDGFVTGACDFFRLYAQQPAEIGSPYVAHDSIVPLEFTAAIRVTGTLRGTVYVSASRAMLTIMLMRMGATDITADNMRKILRNLASAMVASARRDCGDDVLVRDPSVASERMDKLDSGREVALIAPLHWRNFTAQVVACME